MKALLLAALLIAPLTACSDKGDGTTISFNASDPDGNASGRIDGASGKVAIKAPGFSGSLTLPKIKIDAGDVDFNGVNLYPGSTVSTMDINATSSTGNGEGDKSSGKVRIGFESPADPATVRAWFADRLGKADFTLTAQGNSLIGTDDEKKPFRIDFAPTGTGKTKGVVIAGD